MTKIPKHQKGSQLKAIMQEKINSGFFNKKDAREAKKALQYIEDDLFYFKNSDGTYSVRQEQQGTTTTSEDGTTTTTDPQLEVTTNATGLHSNTGPLSLSRLGVGQGNKGSRKVANVMGYLMKSGDMKDYDSYRKAQEDKKKEEDKNKVIKTEGTGATLTTDQDKLDNKEQDTIISNQIANIKDSDIIYVNSTIDQVEAQYGLKEGDPIPTSVKTITNAEGETVYQIPTTNISAGGGAKQTFVLDKSTGTWQVGSPLAGDASAIESFTNPKTSFTGSSALDYQKFLAEQMKEKLMSGEVTEAQLSEKGINPNNLFNTNKNVSEYAKIISMTGDVNSDQGQFTDGTGKTFSTGFDGLIGGATGKVEELLGITRPSNLQKAKSTRTKTGSGGGDDTTPVKTISLAEMANAVKTELSKKKGGKLPQRKKGGITFSVVKKFQGGGSNVINTKKEELQSQINKILNPEGKPSLTDQYYLIDSQIVGEYGEAYEIPENKAEDVKKLLLPIYNEVIKLASLRRQLKALGTEAGSATNTTTTQGDSSKLATVEANQTISDTGTRMGDFVIDDAEEKMARVGYGSGIQDMYQTVQGLESTVSKLPDNPTEDQINKVRDFVVKQALALKTSADASYKALDSDWAKYETSGKGLFWDTKGSPSQVLKDLEASFFDLSESAKRAKTKEELLALIQSIPQPKIESQKQGGKFALGGKIDDMTYELLKYKGYSDEKILSLVEANQQTNITNTSTVGGTPVTDSAGSPIEEVEVGGGNKMGQVVGTGVGIVGLGLLGNYGRKKLFSKFAKSVVENKTAQEKAAKELKNVATESTAKKGIVDNLMSRFGYDKKATPDPVNPTQTTEANINTQSTSVDPNLYSTKINRSSITGTLNARETLAARKKALLEKQSQFIQTNNQKQLERPLLEINRIKKDGGVIYEDGGNPQFTPIATDSDGNKFKASQSGKVYYDLGDGNWTEADSQEIYDYGKQIIQSQIKPQKSSQQTTQTEQTNQVEQTEQPDEIDTFLNKNQWIPFVGAPTRRKEMDAFDYLTFAGGFVPVVGAGFEAVEAARNLYDEYQANDLDWQDVARNAAEIGVSFVGGKAIGGLAGMGKKAMGFAKKAQDGMKIEKPIINIKELGDNKIIGFKGFKLSKYKKGGKVSPKEESVLERVKTSKYDHLNKYINNL